VLIFQSFQRRIVRSIMESIDFFNIFGKIWEKFHNTEFIYI
jgi:hypothetical protein